jgi:predicted amidophosphoribosyltransferase
MFPGKAGKDSTPVEGLMVCPKCKKEADYITDHCLACGYTLTRREVAKLKKLDKHAGCYAGCFFTLIFLVILYMLGALSK